MSKPDTLAREYKVRYLDGSQVTTTVTCTPGDLESAVEADVRRGDWHPDSSIGTVWIDVEVTGSDGTCYRQNVTIDPPTPRCKTGHEHEWRAPFALVGGLRDNPGVFGNGGGVTIHEICRLCGRHRHTDTWATNPCDGSQGHTSVSYDDPDDASLAWVRSLSERMASGA